MSDAWKHLPRDYLERRYNRELQKVTVVRGCWIASSRRADGYAQVKLTDGPLTWAPRTYAVGTFLRGLHTGAVGVEHSHRCGKGAQGCINPIHIVLESHPTNLDRRACFHTTTCPNCVIPHYIRVVCPHNPPCIRPELRAPIFIDIADSDSDEHKEDSEA